MPVNELSMQETEIEILLHIAFFLRKCQEKIQTSYLSHNLFTIKHPFFFIHYFEYKENNKKHFDTQKLVTLIIKCNVS